MQVFDASSIIYAWDNYPVQQFPGLWDWIADRINDSTIMMPTVALVEVHDNSPDCWHWLRDANLQTHEISNAILQESLRIKGQIGIVGDRYGAGVGENDILIIATASVLRKELVTDEEWQPNLPLNPLKYKIPAVCALPAVRVAWIDFLDYIKRTGAVFR
ncbi:MAG: DUF4411 family protein [Rhodocyclaceae bacterium]|jgi:hypothetical protein|nr:DUF4411 family protein [Rhodocyclaceae bacterium]